MRRIQLGKQQPFASGSARYVFQDPNKKDRVVKVLKPVNSEQNSPLYKLIAYVKWWLERHRVRREMSQLAKHSKSDSPISTYLPKHIEFVCTDYGDGVSVEKIAYPDGRLAPTLGELITQKSLGLIHLNELEKFFRAITQSNIIVGDLNITNILILEDPVNKSIDIKLVDGVGDSTVIPLRTFSKWANRTSKLRKIKRLRSKVYQDIWPLNKWPD